MSELPQRINIASRAATKAKILANNHVRSACANTHDPINKFLRRLSRKGVIETQLKQALNAEFAADLNAIAQCHQARNRLIGLKERARQRLETHQGWCQFGRACDGSLNQSLMTAMQAVEITDGERAAARIHERAG